MAHVPITKMSRISELYASTAANRFALAFCSGVAFLAGEDCEAEDCPQTAGGSTAAPAAQITKSSASMTGWRATITTGPPADCPDSFWRVLRGDCAVVR